MIGIKKDHCKANNNTPVLFEAAEVRRLSVPACVFSQVPPIILTAPETGSTLSWFQKHQPAGGCCDVSPFESRRGKRGEGRNQGVEVQEGLK